jgi:predicted MPP superfamily phosphohydrolase
MRRPGLKIRLLVAAFLAVGALPMVGCGLFDTVRVETVEYACESPDVPSAFAGVRIAFLTDIHQGPYYTEQMVGQLVDRVNALGADLVLLGGDYGTTDPVYEGSCFSELARLQAPLGIFAVLGNHDYGQSDISNPGPGLAIKAAADAGIPLLRNQGTWLEKDGDRIRLGGVADHRVSTSDAGPVIDGTTAGDFVLLVSHNPDFSEDLPQGAVDLVLSGHTHGGQITLLGAWGLLVPSDYGQKYRTGIVKNDVTTVIVSNGIGTSATLPIRVCAPAQIVVVTLRHSAVASVHP